MTRLLPIVTAAYACGVWVAANWHPSLLMMYSGGAALLPITLWLVMRRQHRAAIATLALLFVIVGAVRFVHDDRPSPWDVSRLAGRQVTISGRVVEPPQWWDVDDERIRAKYIVEAASVHGNQEADSPATGKVTVSVLQPKETRLAAFGDLVTVSGKLQPLTGYNNPGAVDTVAARKLQGITARMTVKLENFLTAGTDQASWQGRLEQLRQQILSKLQSATAPGDAAVINGVLFGGYFGIKKEVIRDFATTGLVHILSVSGTHIALVAGVVAWLGARFRLRPGRTAVIAAAAVVIYAVFAGLTPPVVRSVIMGLVALAALVLGREKDTMNALALAALAMLIYQPALLFDISFQLSFSATAGLALFYQPLARRLTLLPSWIAGPVAVTLAAQLGSLPFIAWYFGKFSLVSLLANILVLPLIEAVVVIGLIASLAVFALPLSAQSLFAVCGLLIGAAANLTAALASLPFAIVQLPALGIGAGGAYYLVLLWIFGCLPEKLYVPAELWQRWPERTGAALAVFIIAGFALAWQPRPVTVHFLDVGQGDAALIITPHGRSILIDTGGSWEGSDFDVGERVVLPYLRHYGVTSLDYLILTHGHQDHAGGAAGVAASLPVRRIVLSREDFTPAVAALLRVSGGAYIPAFAGQSVTLDGVCIDILQAAEADAHRHGNERSSVIRVSFGRQSFLFTGDLGPEGEKELVKHGLTPGTVLKVAHHGSKAASGREFLAAYAPRYAVISVGASNRFGHPHPDTLARLAERDINIYRTDRDGAVTFITDGEDLNVSTYIRR